MPSAANRRLVADDTVVDGQAGALEPARRRHTPMPTTTTSASNTSPSRSARRDGPNRRPTPTRPRRARRAPAPTPVRSDTPWPRATTRSAPPTTGPRTFANGTSMTSSTVTRHPRPAQVDATSDPMKPAPITTTRAPSDRGDRGAQGQRVVDGAQHEEPVGRPERLGPGQAPRSGARRQHDARRRTAPTPSSSSTLRPATSSPVARRPSTSCTRELARTLLVRQHGLLRRPGPGEDLL